MDMDFFLAFPEERLLAAMRIRDDQELTAALQCLAARGWRGGILSARLNWTPAGGLSFPMPD